MKLKDPDEAFEKKITISFPSAIWRPNGVPLTVENVPVTWAPTGKFTLGQAGKDVA